MGRPATASAGKDPAKRSEIAIQTLFRARAHMRCPQVSIVAIPNGERRGQKALNRAMREGLAIGFPDVMCLSKGRAAFIEFKAAKGVISDRQQAWIERLNALGFPAIVARDPDDALWFLQRNGFPFQFPMLEAA
jgi:hypothetical protein